MNRLLLRPIVAISASLAVGGTTAEVQPPTISPEVTQSTQRFFDAIRQNNAKDYETVADGVEISYSDTDDNKMSLDRARQEFPDCELVRIIDSQHMSDSAYSFNGTINCKAGSKPTQTIGIIADRDRVYFVRPGGFEPDQKSSLEKGAAEADVQKGLDWMASNPLQVPAGPFKSWSKSDQQNFPATMQNTCTYIWTMAHDAPDRLLPVGVSAEDEWALGIDVCVIGHMPADWPQRGLKLQAVGAVLRKAAAAGSSLKMPANIAP